MLCSCNGSTEKERSEIDSLNTLSYSRKFASMDEAQKYVDEIFDKYGETSYKDGLYEAYINAGNIQGLAMNYDSAKVCYHKVIDDSENDLLLGIADVGMMSVCLMTSQSKEFYDYRYDAQEKLARVYDEQLMMTPHQKMLWNAVCAEYHFVSTNYFIKMRQNEGVMEEIDWLDENLSTFENDTTQMSTYLMIKSLYSVKDKRTDETTDLQRRTLFRLLTMSKQSGNLYFESVALCSIARSILYYGNFKPSGVAMLEEIYNEKMQDDLAYVLVNKALDIATIYGNMFVESNALLVLSDYYLQNGEYEYALDELDHALQLVNIHHKTVNHHSNNVDGKPVAKAKQKQKPDILYTYSTREDTISTEMKWILDPNIVCVADWMLSIREQLSIVYGAMGMKAESDYNHNVYFDILDATRQDQHAQQQQDKLKSEENLLNIILTVLLLVTAGLVWIILIYTKRSQKEHDRKVNMLSEVIEICKKMTTVLSDDFSDKEELTEMMHERVDDDVRALFPQYANEDWSSEDASTLSGLDRELLRILQVFFQWIEKTGAQYVHSVEEQQKLESETYVLSKRYEENKRLYIEKLASMSIVDGITPFLDRALHEVSKLKNGKCTNDTEVSNCLTYLSELIDKINDYNDVLGHWVKIRKGMVTLNVENFALKPLFETMKRGAKSFDIKGVTLNVNDTDGVVKADKSLTIFMMNTLLDNARKYTPEGGSVTLNAVETPEYVEISVSDTGHGMSAEDVDTINNSKVYDSSKIGATGKNATDIKQNKGFGFGLMNCKGIIGKYKKTNAIFNVCEFGVESEIGSGSRFFFRLPKGVLRVLTSLMFILISCISMSAKNNTEIEIATAYSDSVLEANVNGNYEKALQFADTAIYHLNQYYLQYEPNGTNLMTLEKGNMAEITLWKQGFDMDYNLIIGLRNEIAIAALALNRNALYHYNSEVFTRLYILSSTDAELEGVCNDIKLANHNKKTTIAVLGIIILCVLVIYFFLHYRHKNLFIFNLRQFIQLINNVYSSEGKNLGNVFLKNISDIKMTDAVGMMLMSPDKQDQFDFYIDGKVYDRNVYEGLMRTAFDQKTEITGMNDRFYAYPLYTPGKEDEEIFGVLAVCFRNGKLSAEDKRIMKLITEFLRIHTYFSYNKVSQMNETIELMADQKIRVEKEQQNVYVQNMIMDNCMSTLKHETMYYPNRIKQIVDVVQCGESNTEAHINDIDELLSYYKEIFTILSSCASKQVERVLFKRSAIPTVEIGEMTTKSFRKMAKKNGSSSTVRIDSKTNMKIQGDKVFIQALIDNILSLFFEHNSGGQLTVNWEDADGFIKFSFNDSSYEYEAEQPPLLFYVDSLKYDESADRLLGSQYILIKQIIRQHDAFSSRRGCRVYVENDGNGGSNFVFTLSPKGDSSRT